MSGRLRKDDGLSAAARIIEAESESSSAFYRISSTHRSAAFLQRALERITELDAGLCQVFR